MPQDFFSSTTLQHSDIGRQVVQIIEASLKSVDPFLAVKQKLRRKKNHLIATDVCVNIEDYRNIYLIGFGKAAYPMAGAVVELLGDHLKKGLIIVKDGHLPKNKDKRNLGKIQVFEASHPLPDERGVQATRRILDLAASTSLDDLVICLVSGGGSALLTAPVESVRLEDIQLLTGELLLSGASIDEVNTLRKHLDQVKGGGLAKAFYPSKMITLILSDVVGDQLGVIASGPTAPDDSTFQDCSSILKKYDLLERVPKSITQTIQNGINGEIPENPKANDSVFQKIDNLIIGNNYLAAASALANAEALGFQSILLTTYIQGEASSFGQMMASIARQIQSTGEPVHRPACVIAGGETTVTVRGKGTGGRNLEAALGSVQDLANMEKVLFVTLATDGGDGLTDSAGAVVSGKTLERAASLGFDLNEYLKNNDSYPFFQSLNDLLKTGPTSTNVNDLAMLFMY